jgi:hypothetical protein
MGNDTPFVTMLVFTVVFGSIAGPPEPALPVWLRDQHLCRDIFLWLGIHKFRSMEKSFADLI